MSRDRIELGRAGEEMAADFLRNNGYRILFSNYKTKLGEIDIIAKDKDTICFVEVKTRATEKFGFPQEAVSFIKQRQIAKAALTFLKDKSLLDKKARFDVVSVMLADARPKIKLIKDAFELNKSFTY
jgi:putative endonuclease